MMRRSPAYSRKKKADVTTDKYDNPDTVEVDIPRVVAIAASPLQTNRKNQHYTTYRGEIIHASSTGS
jgi:hypothetical protein